MHNHLYKYLTGKKILYPPQFGFQKATLENIQLFSWYIDQIRESLKIKTTPLEFLLTFQRRLIKLII